MAQLQQMRQQLEALYAKYNHRECVPPDPLQFVFQYDEPGDREVVGLIAACLSFGTVAQIGRSAASVLAHLPEPRRAVLETPPARFARAFAEWRHRFVTGSELCSLLGGMRRVIVRYGSLQACFARGLKKKDTTVLPALTVFVDALRGNAARNYLIPSPADGSACKRLNLFLRWMVRHDAVDPGVWNGVPTSKLVVPLDTHMHRVALQLGLTRRKQANLRAALEITDAFRKIAPDDPVRYDFALTRRGILKDGASEGDHGNLLKTVCW